MHIDQVTRQSLTEHQRSQHGLWDNRVAVSRTGLTSYDGQPPFHPNQDFPEYAGGKLDPANRLYGFVRETLALLGLDADNFGRPEWNPLGEIIEPGMAVVVKPNLVSHRNEAGHSLQAVITQAAVLRPVLDYITTALRGDGHIVIVDSPYLFGLFDDALRDSCIADLVDWHRQTSDIPIECLDLRLERAVETPVMREWQRTPIKQDPKGYRWVNLGSESWFHDIDPTTLRIGVSDPAVMREHHSDGRHEYLFARTFLDADAVVHVPKLKTHRRAGMSLGLKSFMGFPACKDTLPHYRVGSPEEGGDQYPNKCCRKRMFNRFHDLLHGPSPTPLRLVYSLMKRSVLASGRLVPFRDNVLEGMWPGNDTIWRTLNDLVRIGYYADRTGVLRDVPQRRHFYFVDGIVGGQGNGPVAPSPIESGVLMAAHNPVALDSTAATLMGFDIDRIPQIARPLHDERSLRPLFVGDRENIRVLLDDEAYDLTALSTEKSLQFVPHHHWSGHLQRGPSPSH